MRLIDSMLEDEIRQDLINSRIDPLTFQGDKRILDVLRKSVLDLKAGYFLGWTPEQGEDIYIILADDKSVFKIEVSRLDSQVAPIWEKTTLSKYQKLVSGKNALLKCLIAADLLQ